MVPILDGKGTGYAAEVDSENRLATRANTIPNTRHLNVVFGDVFLFPFSITPTDGKCFLYIENTHTSKILVLTQFVYASSVSTALLGYLSQVGTPTGGSDGTPVNVNSQINASPSATFQTGADITGLSGGRYLGPLLLATGNQPVVFDFTYGLILGTGSGYSVYAETGGTIRGFVVGHYQDPGTF